jgi:chloramphenicol-sensitive protein RarD
LNKGILYGIACYLVWGLLPIYWKRMAGIPATQLIGHRIVWSFLTLLAIIVVSKQWRAFRTAVSDRRVIGLYAAAAALITVNWFVYVWGVNRGFIVETSLGYFINPLVSVVFGVLVFGERLRPLQWVSVGLAAGGVLFLTVAYGALPWIALVLALSFGSYGMVKKMAPLGSMYGLTVETGILLAPAVLYLLYIERAGTGAFLHQGAASDAFLLGTGAVTTIPLLLFASAVTRVPLSTIGVLQYIAPTMQLFLGVFVYGEPFTLTQLIGFAIVWTGLAIFGVDGMLARRVPVTAIIDEGAG